MIGQVSYLDQLSAGRREWAAVRRCSNCSSKMAHMEGTINLEAMFLENGYRLGEKLGKGSFAVVKKVLHLPTGRELAVKIVDHNLATKEFLEKFLSREMNIIGGIKHPNIIDVEKVKYLAF